MPITTTLDLQKYLTSKDIPCAEAEALTGGTANFVWRITTLLGRSSIIKHAEPYIASNAAMAFPVDRMDFEAKALRTIPGLLQKAGVENDGVALVGILGYDAENHVLRLEDGGAKTLKEAYSTEQGLDVPALGGKLGRWIAGLHNATTDQKVRGEFENRTAKFIYRHSYRNLATGLEKYGFDGAFGDHINEKYGSLLEGDAVCVCHGDFWSGNVLVGGGETDQEQGPKLTVVDLEMVRSGNGVTDVGQFAAEAWLLDRFRGGKGLLSPFLAAYVGERQLGEDNRRRVAVHFGTHIAFWPTVVEWGDDAQIKEVVGIGMEVLEKAENGDWEWFKSSMLKELFV
jgi:hypothetical protein